MPYRRFFPLNLPVSPLPSAHEQVGVPEGTPRRTKIKEPLDPMEGPMTPQISNIHQVVDTRHGETVRDTAQQAPGGGKMHKMVDAIMLTTWLCL